MSENLKPLSIKQLIDKLNLIMKEFVSENDYVFFTPGEDEGMCINTSFNVSCPSLKLNKSELKKLLITEVLIYLCFSNNVY
jgi:hypothetical protein